MTELDLQILKANVDKLVRVFCRDGEIFIAKALSISDEERDLVYDLIWTSKESQYEKLDVQPAYRIGFEDIEAVEPYERHNADL
jgi:hypothetical protein